jgi:hypothetical protein
MTENTRQVLEMLAEGKITTEEADRLISALREQPSAPGVPPAKPRFLRVIVDAEDSRQGPVKVNIRVPLMLLRAGVRLASVIPPQAQEKVNRALREQGVDLDISTIKPENLEELIDELRDLTVDIEQQRDDVKVKVFVE